MGLQTLAALLFPYAKVGREKLFKYLDQAQKWEERWELTLLLSSCLGNRARARQQSLVEVTKLDMNLSQEHGEVKKINTIISSVTF